MSLPVTESLNNALPYLFGSEPENLELLSEELPDGAGLLFLGFGPGLMAVAMYESAGWNKYTSFAVDYANFSGLEHLKLLHFPTTVYTVHATTDEAVQMLKGEFDAIFVDADHSYEAVSNDIYNWAPHVKVGGYIWFHDYFPQQGDLPNNGVKRAVDEWDKEGFRLFNVCGSSMIFRREY